MTPMTVWRDLVAMEERGVVRRSRGRVARADVRVVEPDYSSKADHAAAAKARSLPLVTGAVAGAPEPPPGSAEPCERPLPQAPAAIASTTTIPTTRQLDDVCMLSPPTACFN